MTSTRAHAFRPRRPAHTFSIVARDPDTGEMGVAVQSHWFAVGATIPWAEAGVGAVATQAAVPLAECRMRNAESGRVQTFSIE